MSSSFIYQFIRDDDDVSINRDIEPTASIFPLNESWDILFFMRIVFMEWTIWRLPEEQ